MVRPSRRFVIQEVLSSSHDSLGQYEALGPLYHAHGFHFPNFMPSPRFHHQLYPSVLVWISADLSPLPCISHTFRTSLNGQAMGSPGYNNLCRSLSPGLNPQGGFDLSLPAANHYPSFSHARAAEWLILWMWLIYPPSPNVPISRRETSWA